ncbi:MAG: ABC transporter substrate-binding protein, partial [Patescibacteria group bacterium]|nr:ABC transporter substrate-binding protein [Patescibacteria group bacterium]
MTLTRRFRKPLWILNSFIDKHKKLILSFTVVGIIVFLFFKNLLPLIPKPNQHIKIGIVGQYTMNSIPSSISQNIGRGLMKVDSTGIIKTDLAKSWEVLEEETVYKIYLKTNTLWSDGTLISSKDISLDIPNIETSYPDESIIKFKLKEPFSPFLLLLTKPLFKNNTVSAGDYMVKKIKYQGPYLKLLNLTSSKNDLIYKFYPSHYAGWLGFKLGEVDQLQNIITNPLNEKWLKKVNLEKTTNQNEYLAILFNLNDKYLSSKPLRQSLAYAIENKTKERETRALTSINPKSWAYNSKVKPYNYNSAQAKELFNTFSKEASFSGKLKITLGTSDSFLERAENIALSWEKVLDVDIDVKIINSIDNDFQAILIAQEIPLDPDQHALWHSTQETNITHYQNLKVDKLLEDGRTISDPKKRKEIY